MKRIATLSFAAVVLIMGCVVIPDKFEAKISIEIRHVEEQADNLLDYVQGKTETLEPVSSDSSRNWFGEVLAAFNPISVAYAQEMKDDSPLIKELADKMRSRFNDLEALRKKGAIGENNRGYVELVDDGSLSGDEKNAAQRLLSAENDDRKALYQEVARINSDQSLKVGTVESVYARKRLERAKAGEKFQLPPAGEDFDAFKSSTAGRKLGSAVQPGAWVTIK